MSPIVEVRGCPVADGGGGCCHNCAGGWPGTKITTEAMTRAVNNGGIDPSKLGCGPLEESARQGLQMVREQKDNAGEPPGAEPLAELPQAG
ncbi:MAG: hypothetical protein UY27_C0012G0008 [Candidatus Gottesmanbacteria bacterium GW2011_GWA1_48_13]|uniref:Uncharacterized protein n=1 Tax=Candidatus Gottesmanbacteria bacterium GW2011_GWA1_48_13 TaxID=1618439 RepID=A0A0G1UNF9_9BACT|nr:MAG: hypothetical protein UY27_C0012G0008 [Candidatus Gottesmanbacteria bacterium GW2011_GWA1_48_13]